MTPLDGRPKISLDYSSLADERTRETQEEKERHEARENYNEATLGERHPFASLFLRLAVYALIVALIVYFLPRWIERPLTIILLLTFVAWEQARYGSRSWRSPSHRWLFWPDTEDDRRTTPDRRYDSGATPNDRLRP